MTSLCVACSGNQPGVVGNKAAIRGCRYAAVA